MDRDREGPNARKVRLADLSAMAERDIATAFATRADSLAYLRFVVGHAFKRLCTFDRHHDTRAFFGRLASGDEIKGLVRDMEWAESQWSNITAANDDRGAK
jgi:hypothetical protein